MNSSSIKARLRAAGERAALPGETVHPEVIERSAGTATVGVIFKKGHQATEDVMVHGSWYTEQERQKLVSDATQMLGNRNHRSATR